TGWVSAAGKYVEVFEKKICASTGAKFAVACSSGTAGLHVSLKLCGVGQNDEVIVPTLTFIAPVNTVRYLGAEPVFMDCDEFMNLDPEKLNDFCKNKCVPAKNGLKNKISGRIIKAVVPVHVFGNPCDMNAIMALARRYNLKVVEDATESLGSRFISGKYKSKQTGVIGDFGVYSFNGNKIITTGGGGMVVTGKKHLARKLKYLTTQAKDDVNNYIHNEIGYNYRLSNVQAALGVAQLEKLTEHIKLKRRNYFLYKKWLEGLPGIEFLGAPGYSSPNYWLYSVLLKSADKDDFISALKRKNIEARPVWQLNHLQKPYMKCYAHKIKRALYFHERVVNIPSSSGLTESDARRVSSAIKEFLWKR
ncbi:MAG: LegC family aminotransferase, partial [Elusimicrobia bacterium]|nr:LegC family aminotransferase [Elusimicrobiota bacterium]